MAKKTIAVVSGSLHAANAVTGFIRKDMSDYKVVNYLDGFMLKRYGKEGHVTDRVMQRVLKLIETACNDGADIVLLTCTVFSAYQSVFSTLFRAPVFCAQNAMLEALSRSKGKKAILCNQDEATEAIATMYKGICRQNNLPANADIITLPDPYADDAEISVQRWTQMVLEKLKEMDGKYDTIGLAQSPMVELSKNINMKYSKLLTNECVLELIRKKINAEEL